VIERTEIEAVITELGAAPYRARQVYEALTRGLAVDFDEITVLPRQLRVALAARLSPLTLEEADGWRSPAGDTEKTLFATHDGHGVEAVLLRYPRRFTVCVSSQVGCAVGCPFCSSGRLGFARQLTAEEMADQVLHYARRLRDEGRRVTNVVFMGMGEPLLNADETLRACRLLNDPDGFALAARALSVSTVGVVPGIERLTREAPQVNLAVSLHAGTDELRDRLVPLNRRFGLDAVFAACRRHVTATHRKLFFEWIVLPGVNDGDEQVAAAAARLRRPLYHLNLIPYNATGGAYRSPTREEVEGLRSRFEAAGVQCTVRRSPGAEIEAACGQLALRRLSR
jgi:23S rRNA (adenine2503-C2)-methyltransferase